MALPDTGPDSIIATRRWYQRMIEVYLEECFERRKPARVIDLARRLGADRSATSRLVAQLFGKALGDIMRDRQFEYAARMLAHTPLEVVEVGRAAAFGNTTTFFRAFRKHFGMTPAEYRANATKRQ